MRDSGVRIIKSSIALSKASHVDLSSYHKVLSLFLHVFAVSRVLICSLVLSATSYCSVFYLLDMPYFDCLTALLPQHSPLPHHLLDPGPHIAAQLHVSKQAGHMSTFFMRLVCTSSVLTASGKPCSRSRSRRVSTLDITLFHFAFPSNSLAQTARSPR